MDDARRLPNTASVGAAAPPDAGPPAAAGAGEAEDGSGESAAAPPPLVRGAPRLPVGVRRLYEPPAMVQPSGTCGVQ